MVNSKNKHLEKQAVAAEISAGNGLWQYLRAKHNTMYSLYFCIRCRAFEILD